MTAGVEEKGGEAGGLVTLVLVVLPTGGKAGEEEDDCGCGCGGGGGGGVCCDKARGEKGDLPAPLDLEAFESLEEVSCALLPPLPPLLLEEEGEE